MLVCALDSWNRKDSLQAVILCFFMTFIPIFNIPVFWPILVIYFMVWMAGGRDFTDVVYCDHA